MNSPRMRTCVVLCTYNGERFLGPQLDSLLAQTRRPECIVIADDASDDGTWSLLEGFRGRAETQGVEVDAARNPCNLGFARNFSDAMVRAEGDIVFLCDQDDVWHAEKIERMAAEFERRPRLGLLHADARLIDGEGADLGYSLFGALEVTRDELRAEHSGDAFDVLLRRNIATGATMALRHDCMRRLLPVPDGWAHDEWLALGVSLMAQVDCLEWAAIGYRQHGGNQIGVHRRSLGEKMTGVGRPDKREYMHKLSVRIAAMHAWAERAQVDLPPARLRDMRARSMHAAVRAGLSKRALWRFAQVFAELRSGRYARYSAGLRSIVSDLLDLN